MSIHRSKAKAQPEILSFVSSKGGVGKSTICATVAGALGAEGRRVHVVDLDQNRTIARWAQSFPAPNVTVAAIKADDLGSHLAAVIASGDADTILTDVAGSFEKALIFAVARSDLAIIPAQVSEPDFAEALKIMREIRELGSATGKITPYRLLLAQLDPLPTRVLDFVLSEIERLDVPRFETGIMKRTLYREMFLSGALPHAADRSGKARAEIAALLAEIRATLKAPRTKARRAVA